MHIIAEPGCEVFKLVALLHVGRSLESKRGLVQATSALLKKATKLKSNKILHEYLDRYSIQIEVYSTPNYLTVQLHCQKQFVEKAIPILFEIIFQADFKKHHWSLVRRQIIDHIEQQMMQTDFWADKLLSEHLLGPNHPYGYYSQPEDYLNIHLIDIEAFYYEHIIGCKLEFFLAGDNTDLAKRIIQSEFQKHNLKNYKKRNSVLVERKEPLALEKKIVGSSQASVRLGKIFQMTSFDDFKRFELFNMYLGGHYISELMKLLRIELGLTYGVYSYINHFPECSVFNISFETDRKNVTKALNAISELFNRLYKKKRFETSEASREYYSQWSKNSEKSLQEIMYSVKLYKLDFDLKHYIDWVRKLEFQPISKTLPIDQAIVDFSTYSKSIVY